MLVGQSYVPLLSLRSKQRLLTQDILSLIRRKLSEEGSVLFVRDRRSEVCNDSSGNMDKSKEDILGYMVK